MLRAGFLFGFVLFQTPEFILAAEPALPPAAKVKADFARDIEPLLTKRCLMCHGPQ